MYRPLPFFLLLVALASSAAAHAFQQTLLREPPTASNLSSLLSTFSDLRHTTRILSASKLDGALDPNGGAIFLAPTDAAWRTFHNSPEGRLTFGQSLYDIIDVPRLWDMMTYHFILGNFTDPSKGASGGLPGGNVTTMLETYLPSPCAFQEYWVTYVQTRTSGHQNVSFTSSNGCRAPVAPMVRWLPGSRI